MTLFKEVVEINLPQDGIEITKLKANYNYNTVLGQSFENMTKIFDAWIREHGGDPEQILEDAGHWEMNK